MLRCSAVDLAVYYRCVTVVAGRDYIVQSVFNLSELLHVWQQSRKVSHRSCARPDMLNNSSEMWHNCLIVIRTIVCCSRWSYRHSHVWYLCLCWFTSGPIYTYTSLETSLQWYWQTMSQL